MDYRREPGYQTNGSSRLIKSQNPRYPCGGFNFFNFCHSGLDPESSLDPDIWVQDDRFFCLLHNIVMTIVIPNNEARWDKFVAEHSSPASFLQSWAWGEFQKSLGNKIYRLAVEEAGAPPASQARALRAGWHAAAQVMVKKLPLGKTYLEIPKGPVGNFDKIIFEKLVQIAKQENAILIRISPPYESLGFEISNLGFRKPEILVKQKEPEDSLLVDLLKSEDELLAQMHEKMRYNIGLSRRKNIVVRKINGNKKAFAEFLKLTRETSVRDHVELWPDERFQKFYEMFLAPSPLQGEGWGEVNFQAKLFVAEYQGLILASAVIVSFGDTATYLYGASSNQLRNFHAPSLLLWETMKLAKAEGKKLYDL